MLDGAALYVIQNEAELKCEKMIFLLGAYEYQQETVQRLNSGGASYIYSNKGGYGPFYPQDPAGGDGSDPAPEIRGFKGDRCSPPPMPEFPGPFIDVVLTPRVRVYFNPLGNPAPPVQDTVAFATCP